MARLNMGYVARLGILLMGLSLMLTACYDPANSTVPTTRAGRASAPTSPAVTTQAATTTAAPTTVIALATLTLQAGGSLSRPATTAASTSTIALATSKPDGAPGGVAAVPPASSPWPTLDAKSSGVLVYQEDGDIWALTLPEGSGRPLTTDGSGNRLAFPEGFNRNPVWSPDSLAIAFASARDVSNQPGYRNGYEIYTMRPDGSNLSRLTNEADGPFVQRLPLAWLTTGDLLISQRDQRLSQPSPLRLALLSASTGKTKELPIKEVNLTTLAISPDKTQLVYASSKLDTKPGHYKTDVYLAPLNGSSPPRALTNFVSALSASISAITWSPDGKTIAFSQGLGDACGAYTLYTVGAARNGLPLRKLFGGEGVPTSLSYAPGGRWLAYSTASCIGTAALRLFDTDKTDPPLDLIDGLTPSYGRKTPG